METLLAHPRAVLAYADVCLIGEDGKILQDKDYRPQNQDPEHPEIMRLYRTARPLGYEADNFINACILYRREAAEAMEFHYASDLRGLEDYDFWMRLQKSGPFIHVGNPEPLYYYRVHKRTMSHDILSQQAEREAHVRRINHLMEHESTRRQYAQQRWELVVDGNLPTGEKSQLARRGLPPACWPDQHRARVGCREQKVVFLSARSANR